ncbi:MAG: hypothetical protein L0206_16800 [Actinobacteria bacterium]|nr:hypothetical protein [Actinomycetota bacterium]
MPSPELELAEVDPVALGEPSHAPSTRLGACDECRAGDHGSCAEVTTGGEPCGSESLCLCYDDAWEWHETIALPRSTPPPRFVR